MSQGKRKQVPCVLGQVWETYHYATGPTCPAPTVVRVCGESRPWARSDGSERHLARAIMGAYGYKICTRASSPSYPRFVSSKNVGVPVVTRMRAGVDA